MKTKLLYGVISMTLFGLMLTGCSSSSSTDSSTTNPGPGPGPGGNTSLSTTVGAMLKGSVKVNGVEFQTNADTAITADDVSKAATFLDDGMTVKVQGTVNADGITGVADKVVVVNEARGAITAKGADTLTVHGQIVLVDGGTFLAPAGVTGIASLAQDDNIEVHGGRDDTGVIHATRVEKLGAGAVENEVRGAVSGKAATTFNIGSLNINFANAVMVPAGAAFANGDVVEVHLNGAAATQITVERLQQAEFEPVEGKDFSIEGILSSYGTASVFNVGAQQVQLGSTASIVGGVLADLINGLKVEAEGHTVTGGVLTAEKITIDDNIRIEANADGPGSVNVLGKTFLKITSGTRPDGLASGASLTTGDGLRIRGFVNTDGVTVTATRVDKQANPIASNKTIIQGPVKNIDATGHTFTILGITISAGSSIARPNDDRSVDNTQTMLLADFFSALAADRTIVKAKGTFSGGTLTATEIELE